ncbi:MAG: penicillin-binding protein 2, partial [Chloroflexota bacterium]
MPRNRTARRALVFAMIIASGGWWLSDRLDDTAWLLALGTIAIGAIAAMWPRPRSSRTGRGNQQAVVKLGIVLMSLFGVLTLQLVRIQAWQQAEIASRVAVDRSTGEVAANPRIIDEDLRVQRGRILDRRGAIVAETIMDGGLARRSYPDPNTAYVAGFFSPLLYGRSGLEATYDAVLRGDVTLDTWTEWAGALLGRPPKGLDLQLTLDATLQQRAHELLGDRVGAVVLVEVRTGAVLVLASNPHFDPEALVTTGEQDRERAADEWQALLDDPRHPLLLRATQGLYTPGSTFKTVVAAAAINEGIATPDSLYRDDGSLNVDGHIINEANRPDDSISTWTLRDALAFSLNVVFAQVGLALGADNLWQYAERFGFGVNIPFDLPVARGQVASSREFLDSAPAVADTGFGQGELLATPLHMALVAAAIANDGAMMQPYLVQRILTRVGDVRSVTKPRVWQQTVAPETARQVREMMIHAVTNGYVSGAAIEGFVVGGKTGTAETGDGDPHAWFIGFVGDPEPEYAVAVVLEHGGAGLAAPLAIGREMM